MSHTYCMDVIQWAKEYDGPPFHALLSDPPYHLSSIVKRFSKTSLEDDTQTSEDARNRSTPYARGSAGFMGQDWDGGDIAFRHDTWIDLARHLYPGAFGMAYGAARNYHRLAAAIEDAGLIIHPMIGWVYSSGMPKATRIDTQIDKMAGKLDERKVVGQKKLWGHNAGTGAGSFSHNAYEGQTGITRFEPIMEPATDLAKAFSGYRYSLQALKPALEPIVVFQKPYGDRAIDDIMATGAGALNIDGGRIPSDEPYTINTWDDNAHPFGDGAGNEYTGRNEQARWPANIVLEKGLHPEISKFFYNVVEDQLDEADPICFCKKASTAERMAGLEEIDTVSKSKGHYHPTVKPIDLSRYLATLLLPPADYAPRRIMVPFAGVHSEAIGAMLAGWEDIAAIEFKPAYCEIGKARIKYWKQK